MSNPTFKAITLISVTGLPDARGPAMALQLSLHNMPGATAVLCSPHAPDNLHPHVKHVQIAPMNYHEYSWFMMFTLWQVVHTEFALIVQDDGWVINGDNWTDDFLNYDYLGAPVHLARIETEQGANWSRGYDWFTRQNQPGCRVTPVLNGGFSLRSQRMMRALVDHPDIKVHIPPPQLEQEQALKMRWEHGEILEDVQLTGVLRPELQSIGLRYPPLDLARRFSVEHATHPMAENFDFMCLFGHHAKARLLASLSPLTVHSLIPGSELDRWQAEIQILQMLERNGYRVEIVNP